ncbi:Uncharacterised protein [uncultured archaeon]|nr:Uncharacterised protein [uncultured archaeon]
MNRYLILGIIVVIIGIIFSIPLLSDQLANARTIKKIQFTQTITSTQDPGQGHGNEQLALVLPPNYGTLYDGSLTYTSSEPVQVVILHQINNSDSKGQPTWTVDGNTIYAETVIDSNSNGGSIHFTGSAIGLHSLNSSQFTVTASVDGWIRSTTQMMQQAPQIISESSFKIPNPEIFAKIPMHKALYNGDPIYYIITDSSNSNDASQISNNQDWKVQPAPLLSKVPQEGLNKLYIFTNGVSGNGTKGFQDEVFSNSPQDNQYSPLSLVVQVSWNMDETPVVLKSVKDILDANMSSKISLKSTNTIMNTPQIVWPNGQVNVRDDKTLSDQTSYVGSQVINIDTTNKFVTFLAHRGWGPDGKTVYYIATSGTPEGPAKMMGLMNTPSLSTFSSAARDLYHFTNGIKGAGPFGFQEGITNAQPGDSSYSPICKISTITWIDPQSTTLLENMDDINSAESSNTITVKPATVSNNNYLIDCPIIETPNNP